MTTLSPKASDTPTKPIRQAALAQVSDTNCGWCLLSRSAPDRLGHGPGRIAKAQQRGDSPFHFSDRLVVCRQQAIVELRLETLCGDVRPMLVVLPPDRICRSPPAPNVYRPLFCSNDLWGDRDIEDAF